MKRLLHRLGQLRFFWSRDDDSGCSLGSLKNTKTSLVDCICGGKFFNGIDKLNDIDVVSGCSFHNADEVISV
jgi:hypothetical protein